jgi:hypothetical protein
MSMAICFGAGFRHQGGPGRPTTQKKGWTTNLVTLSDLSDDVFLGHLDIVQSKQTSRRRPDTQLNGVKQVKHDKPQHQSILYRFQKKPLQNK